MSVIHVNRVAVAVYVCVGIAEVVRPESREAELFREPVCEFRRYDLVARLARFRIAPPLPCGSERELVENYEFDAAAYAVDEVVGRAVSARGLVGGNVVPSVARICDTEGA